MDKQAKKGAMDDRPFTDYLNAELAKVEAAGIFPREILVELRTALTDPDTIAQLKAKARNACLNAEHGLLHGDTLRIPLGMSVVMRSESPHRLDEIDARMYAHRAYLNKGPIIHENAFVTILDEQ